jgi:hypothetical protein
MKESTTLRLSELNRVAEFRRNWADLTLRHKSEFWQNFAMTFPETLHTKNAVNEYSFTSVTHMAYSDTRFGRYGFLMSGYGAELILDRTDR